MGNYGWGLPVAASTFAADIDTGLWLIHISMLALFAAMAVVFIYFLGRYRARPGQKARYSHGSLFLSLALLFPGAVLVEEALTIVTYAAPTWNKVMRRPPAPEESEIVECVAQQFAWNFRYPGADKKFGRRDLRFFGPANPMSVDPEDPAGRDDVVSVNQLRLPLGKPVLLRLTSQDVIHSFFVPEFRVKRDAVPGLVQEVYFEPTRPGKYEIACSQVCGAQHFAMRGDVIVHTPEEFRSWLAARAAEGR